MRTKQPCLALHSEALSDLELEAGYDTRYFCIVNSIQQSLLHSRSFLVYSVVDDFETCDIHATINQRPAYLT